MIQFTDILFSIYGIDIYAFMNGYPEKDSFIEYLCKPGEKDKIEYLKKKIRYDQGGRIGEVGWGLSVSGFGGKRRTLKDVSKEETNGIVKYAFKHNVIKKYLYEVELCDYDGPGKELIPDDTPRKRLVGDILFSKPCGLAGHKLGGEKLAQRIGKLCTRYGFSELDEYGWQFAIYNENLKLEPI